MLGKFISDFRGIARVCGVGPALRWSASVAITIAENLRTRNLLAADLLMGSGPFPVAHPTGNALLVGKHAFSGLREIWVRDVYTRGDFLKVPDGGTVVDMGANMGNFSAMALASNPSIRLIAVEPSSQHAAKWHDTIKINDFVDRAVLCESFVGNFTPKQQLDFDTDPFYQSATIISEVDFLEKYKIDRIDFLKCDIEGSEFYLMEAESRILDITDRIAIELHDFGGDVHQFLEHLVVKGFTDMQVEWHGGECIARAARPKTSSENEARR
jgi:FkbM family methyltransferase